MVLKLVLMLFALEIHQNEKQGEERTNNIVMHLLEKSRMYEK